MALKEKETVLALCPYANWTHRWKALIWMQSSQTELVNIWTSLCSSKLPDQYESAGQCISLLCKPLNNLEANSMWEMWVTPCTKGLFGSLKYISLTMFGGANVCSSKNAMVKTTDLMSLYS